MTPHFVDERRIVLVGLTVHQMIPCLMFIEIEILEEVMLSYAEEEMLLKRVFQQNNNPKHTSNQQHLGSRPTRLTLWSGQPNPWTLIQWETGGVTSKMPFLWKNHEMQRNW